jgi:two-component system, OmpR family, alkaline phosphatase synthesis response regulator PhoP
MENEKIVRTILIVDDEIPLLRALVDKCSNERFNVLEGKDGQEGLESALENHPDLILLDIMMPRMDGLTMLEKLRLDNWGKDVPVILLTNLNDPDKVAEAVKYGVYDYLVKTNWKLEDVINKINEKIKLIPMPEEE